MSELSAMLRRIRLDTTISAFEMLGARLVSTRFCFLRLSRERSRPRWKA